MLKEIWEYMICGGIRKYLKWILVIILPLLIIKVKDGYQWIIKL